METQVSSESGSGGQTRGSRVPGLEAELCHVELEEEAAGPGLEAELRHVELEEEAAGPGLGPPPVQPGHRPVQGGPEVIQTGPWGPRRHPGDRQESGEGEVRVQGCQGSQDDHVN